MDLEGLRAPLWAAMVLGVVGCPSPNNGIDFTGTETSGSTGTDASSAGTTEGPVADSSGGAPACEDDTDCVGDPAGEFCDIGMGVCGPPCQEGDTRPCYSGPAGTEGVGACAAGVNVCTDEQRWALWCDGEVLPAPEVCGNQADDDCDGLLDDTDADGDGFGVCNGDCCDLEGTTCVDAHLVNPGAYEVVGNELDDDCDGMIDEPPQACDAGLASDSNDPEDFATSLDLCQTTFEAPPTPAQRTWGVISASLTRADGSGSPLPVQHALRNDFGDFIDAEEGERMVVLSSGHAADENDSDPAFASFENGQNLNTVVPAPADWLAANGGVMPNPAGCLEPWNTSANDSVMLTLRVRAPTNASSFSVGTFFFSAEYPEWVCSEFNDFFVALIDSTADNPADKNIAIYDDDGTQWPLGVNLVMVADGLFTQCENGDVGCARDLDTNYGGCIGETLLTGTGFDQTGSEACGGSQERVGGGTGWLRMSGNVTPGEIFEIRFAIWDTSGHLYDSLVLLDDWVWSVDAAEPGVAPR